MEKAEVTLEAQGAEAEGDTGGNAREAQLSEKNSAAAWIRNSADSFALLEMLRIRVVRILQQLRPLQSLDLNFNISLPCLKCNSCDSLGEIISFPA